MLVSARRSVLSLGCVLLLALFVLCEPSLLAQETPEGTVQRVRFVGVISGPELNSSAARNTGDEGLSRLTELLVSYGATVNAIAPNTEIPPQIELVILVRPQRALSAAQTAHLWDFVQRGGHLLLAVDPNGHNRSATESARTSGINRLLQAEYGLSLVDDLLIEDWFGLENMGDVLTSWSEAWPEDLIPHAITRPLVEHQLPIHYWGGRSVQVDAVTGNADADALLFVERPYGEAARLNYQNGDTSQLTFNIGTDTQGRLLLGGISTNYATGSRVAVIGDSEIFQNLFGQTRVIGHESLPLYVGNNLFVQRLLAWLMAVPEEEYPGLPQGFTWIVLDGSASEWPENVPVLLDQQSADTEYALQQVRAFQNDQFVYLLLGPQNPLPTDSIVYVFVEDNDGNHQLLSLNSQGNILFRDKVLPDAAIAIGDAIEIRLPRRIFTTNSSLIAQICIAALNGSSVDCLDDVVRPFAINEIDPLPVRSGTGPHAFTTLTSVNLRSEPNTSSAVIVTFPLRTLLAVTGRNNAGDWVYVQNGRYEGWVSRPLLAINADVESLPSLEPIPPEGSE